MPKRSSAIAKSPAAEVLPLPAVRHPIQRRIVRQSLLLIGMSIVLLGITSFFIAKSFLSGRAFSDVSRVGGLREDVLERALQSDRERTAIIAGRSEWKHSLSAEEAAPLLTSLLAELRRQSVAVRGLSLFSLDRKIVASTGDAISPLLSDTLTTAILPVVDRKDGWVAEDVFVPLTTESGKRIGYLAARYDSAPTVAVLFSDASLGGDSAVTLGYERGGEMFIVRHSGTNTLQGYDLGSVDDPFLSSLPLAQAVQGEEGVRQAKNEHGESVFASYRFLPTLGWGMVVEVRASDALRGTLVLGVSVTLIGLLLLALAGLLATMLARSLTQPLRSLTSGMQGLRPGHWEFKRSVHSGDEVEVLDAAFADLTARLREAYAKLEDLVEVRTEELHHESALDHAILETIEYGVLSMDPEGVVIDANPAAIRLLGHKKEEMLGKSGAEILQYLQRRKIFDTKDHPLCKVLKTHEPFHSHPGTHPALLRSNQTLLPITLSLGALVEDKKLLGAIAVFQDMTEERQIDYMKSEFISLASHQLRTPLASIRWYIELLTGESKKGLSEEQEEYFSEIGRASQRMASLLESLLHVARLEGGAIVPEKQKVDLAQIIDQMSDDWKVISKEKGITFAVSLPSRSLHMHTDPVLLQVILQNFLANALKYSPKGQEIHLRVRHEHKHVILSVHDTGLGIPEAEQKRVFEKFFRAHNVRTLDTDGTGLGLYISKSIAERLGGQIAFESQEGKGSTFTLILPEGK